MNDITKVFRSLEESGLFTKEISKTIKNKIREEKVCY